MAFITLVLHTFSERLIAWFKSLFRARKVQFPKTDSKPTTIYILYQETEGGLEPLDVCFRRRENAEAFMRSRSGVITLIETKLVDLEIYDETNPEKDHKTSQARRLTLSEIMAQPVPEMTPEDEKEFKMLEDLFGS